MYHRCIVMVGLPYPNLRSAELKEKMEYLNVHMVSWETTIILRAVDITFMQWSSYPTLVLCSSIGSYLYSVCTAFNFASSDTCIPVGVASSDTCIPVGENPDTCIPVGENSNRNACVWAGKISCWPLLRNQSFYRQIAGCGMGVGDHRVGQWWKGVMGQQNSYKTLIGVHSTMHLMHLN